MNSNLDTLVVKVKYNSVSNHLWYNVSGDIQRQSYC